MAEEKTAVYILQYGVHAKAGGEFYRKGDEVELTEAQAAVFGAKFKRKGEKAKAAEKSATKNADPIDPKAKTHNATKKRGRPAKKAKAEEKPEADPKPAEGETEGEENAE